MASIAEQTSYNMFPRPTEHQDFLLYSEQQAGAGYASPPMDHQYSPEAFGFPHTAGFEVSPLYTDLAHMTYDGRTSPGAYAEDAELRVPSSNMSTTSASSSNMGSPHSHNGQLAYVPEYSHNALGVNPSIVSHDNYFTGTEYTTYMPQPMEGYDMTYTTADSKPGFVGKSTQIPRSLPQLDSSSSLDALDTAMPPSAISSFSSPGSTPMSTPTSAAMFSPVSSAPSVTSPVVNAATQWSSPISPVTPANSSSSSRFSFFSQSSGHFVAPLGSYCRFSSV